MSAKETKYKRYAALGIREKNKARNIARDLRMKAKHKAKLERRKRKLQQAA